MINWQLSIFVPARLQASQSDYRKIDDHKFYVFEEEDDGYFVLAMLMSTRPDAGCQSLYFGLVRAL